MSSARIDQLRREAATDTARVSRFYSITIDSPLEMHEREDGSWELDGVATRGDAVFDYSSEAGEEWREFRPLAEVFARDSIESLIGATITDDHPAEFVNIHNARQHTRGVVMRAWQDGTLMRVRVIIRDAELIEKIKAGKVELSCGYTAYVVPGEGDHATEGHYHATQTQIIHNHLAVVDVARAGPVAKLAVPPPQLAAPAGDSRQNKRASTPEGAMGDKKAGDAGKGSKNKDNMGEITVNGATYPADPAATTVPPAVAEALNAASTTIEELKARILELESANSGGEGEGAGAPLVVTPEGEVGDGKAKGDKGRADRGLTRAEVKAMLDAELAAIRTADERRSRFFADAAKSLPASYEVGDKPVEQVLADAIVAIDKSYKAKADALVKAKAADALHAVLEVKLADAGRANVLDLGQLLQQSKETAGDTRASADDARKQMIDRKKGLRAAEGK